MGTSDWMSTKEACEALSVSLRTLYRFIDVGDLPAYRMGRLIRLRRHELEQFIADSKIQPGDIAASRIDFPRGAWTRTLPAEREMRARLDGFIAGYRSGEPAACPLC